MEHVNGAQGSVYLDLCYHQCYVGQFDASAIFDAMDAALHTVLRIE